MKAKHRDMSEVWLGKSEEALFTIAEEKDTVHIMTHLS